MSDSRHLCIGLVAHVDAGKTTLAEAMLYLSGTVRKQGRVDHRDACLDPDTLEKDRGITIFANEAPLSWAGAEWTLLDTPGHVDFASEAERVLPVLDAAVLVISGTDGVQAHTETLRRLLGQYHVPVFIFVTKMDLEGAERPTRMEELRRVFGDGCVDMTDGAEAETLAMLSEEALEEWEETREVSPAVLRRMLTLGTLTPCFFGSGLRLSGVETLMDAVSALCPVPERGEHFGARCFRIGRDGQGNRLTYVKVTGGTLRVRDVLSVRGRDGELHEEKAAQLRIYTGSRFRQVDEIPTGGVCAVLGLTESWPGCGMGAETGILRPVLEPVLTSRVVPPEGCDVHTLYEKLRELEDSDPQLQTVYHEQTGELHVRLMGEVQGEILQSLLLERYGLKVTLEPGKILYRETIADTVEGVGHYEPLRHYAEVHLILRPLPRGSGMVFDTICSGDVLEPVWQRLILSQLQAKTHLGVLTGSPLTDVRVTLAAGRAHEKHTEGGDFREASWRALRHGLMKAKSQLLEPYYRYRLEVPLEQLGRAVSDLRLMGALSSPETEGDRAVFSGRGPVSALRGYAREVAAYTRGRGRFTCTFGGYDLCRDENVIRELGYAPEADLENPPHSVFCAHGAGFVVNWKETESYMHLESCWKPPAPLPVIPAPKVLFHNLHIDDKELEAVMQREFGPSFRRISRAETQKTVHTPPPPRREHLIVDGYNLIFGWDSLRELAARDFSAAREHLCDLLANYRGYHACELVLVFDGYKVHDNPGEKLDKNGVHVVYTKENETGDAYIERLANEIGRNESVRVVTNDGLIRLSALRSGVLRCPVKEFAEELETMAQRLNRVAAELRTEMKTTIGDNVRI